MGRAAAATGSKPGPESDLEQPAAKAESDLDPLAAKMEVDFEPPAAKAEVDLEVPAELVQGAHARVRSHSGCRSSVPEYSQRPEESTHNCPCL